MDGLLVKLRELPAALSQGETIEELKSNLMDAVKLLLEANREETEKKYIDKNVIREELYLAWRKQAGEASA